MPVLHQAGVVPQAIANVDPDGDVRQLVLNHDGSVAAFTASRFKEGEVVHRSLDARFLQLTA